MLQKYGENDLEMRKFDNKKSNYICSLGTVKMKTQKILKDEYKNKKFKIGVFQIKNMVNGNIYIDGNVNLDAIWNRHKMQLNFGNHQNTKLQNDWKKFGEEKFLFEILSEIKQKENEIIDYQKEIKILSEMYIEELKPQYNRN